MYDDPLCSFHYRLEDIISSHRKSPQEKCPLVSKGHKQHGEDQQEEEHEQHGDDGQEGHHVDNHGRTQENHNNKHSKQELLVEDLQTDDNNYYTIAHRYPNNFAKLGKTRNDYNGIFNERLGRF